VDKKDISPPLPMTEEEEQLSESTATTSSTESSTLGVVEEEDKKVEEEEEESSPTDDKTDTNVTLATVKKYPSVVVVNEESEYAKFMEGCLYKRVIVVWFAPWAFASKRIAIDIQKMSTKYKNTAFCIISTECCHDLAVAESILLLPAIQSYRFSAKTETFELEKTWDLIMLLVNTSKLSQETSKNSM
jgi:hypothetical protein